MSNSSKMADTLRQAILSQPSAVLDDHDVMQALVSANEKAMGGNIVDLRGIAMERLEARLMAKKGKSKKKLEVMYLVCEETGDYNYTIRRKSGGEKLKVKKYCPRLRKHTIHNEKKK